MIRIQDLNFCYRGASQAALEGVSFEVDAGEILGLLGPNGAGKTTLISQLAGILPLQKGQIMIDEVPIRRSRHKNPGIIDIAPQEYAFYPTLSVRENLRCFGAIGSSKNLTARVKKTFAFGRLEAYSEQQSQTLSGGLKRRLNLAIAILSNPKYLLLDEPTAGVDPQSRMFLRQAVRKLASEGVGIIYTSHYMEEVETLAKRVVIIDHGNILCDGEIDELLNQEKSLLTFSQSGLSDNAVQEILQKFGELQPHAHQLPERQVLLYAGHTVSAALGALEQAGAKITYVEFGSVNLENLFMRITNRTLRE